MAETKQQQQQQTFFGLPMSWEWNVDKMMRNLWNPEDERVFTPKVFGIGWDVNGHAVLRRLGVIPTASRSKES
jgi:hypothetical protein